MKKKTKNSWPNYDGKDLDKEYIRGKKMPLNHIKWCSISLTVRNVKLYSKVPFLIYQQQKKAHIVGGKQMMSLLCRRVSPPLTKIPDIIFSWENPLPIIYSTDISSQVWNHVYTSIFTATLLVRAKTGKKYQVSSKTNKKQQQQVFSNKKLVE